MPAALPAISCSTRLNCSPQLDRPPALTRIRSERRIADGRGRRQWPLWKAVHNGHGRSTATGSYPWPSAGRKYRSGANTVRLKETAFMAVRRPQLFAWCPWCGPGGWTGRRTGSAVHGDSGCQGSVVGSVLRVSALDHARRSPVDGPGGPGASAGLEQLTEPTSSTSGPLWGERPRSGAVRA
jgi:hypothetical protein